MRARPARPGAVALATLLLSGCVSVEPPAPKQVAYASADAKRLAPMLQSAVAGPLRVSSVVYKPAVLPLSRFLKELSRGEVRRALASTPWRYEPSNVDDDALRLLLKRGYIPVFVTVTNTGATAADARALRLSLADAALNLAPIPDDELPRELRSLDPKAVVADTYNVGVVIVSAATLIGGIIALSALAHGGPDFDARDDRKGGGGSEDSRRGFTEDLIYPVRPGTLVDYNGLLFRPGALAPGETASGLLFFKARGADWSALRLTASL